VKVRGQGLRSDFSDRFSQPAHYLNQARRSAEESDTAKELAMPDAVTHPSLQELTAYGLGKLPAAAADLLPEQRPWR
jgi:hypothetical protein